MCADHHRSGRNLLGQRGLRVDLDRHGFDERRREMVECGLDGVVAAAKRVMDRSADTPAASATAVRLNCRGPSLRSVSVVAASSRGDTDRADPSARI